jgi:hypothetical protein
VTNNPVQADSSSSVATVPFERMQQVITFTGYLARGGILEKVSVSPEISAGSSRTR